MPNNPHKLRGREVAAAAEILAVLRELNPEQATRVLAHVEGQLVGRDDVPRFARGVGGPLGKLICAVKTKLDEHTHTLFLQYCAMRGTDVATVVRDCIYALVHGKSYRQMVVEKLKHEEQCDEVRAKLIGSFGGPESGEVA